MFKKDIIIGLVILVLIVGVVYWFKYSKEKPTLPSGTISTEKTENALEEKFNLKVAESAEKVELKDVSGGDASGITTRTEILADLPDLEPGSFYQAWYENRNGKMVNLGKLRTEKGAWILEFSQLSDGNKILVSLEKTFDDKIEKKILEGSF